MEIVFCSFFGESVRYADQNDDNGKRKCHVVVTSGLRILFYRLLIFVEGLGLVFVLMVFCFMGRFMQMKSSICQIAQKGLKKYGK
jgi:hypothetical protein